jgi:uncharacterized protein YerC
MTQISRRQLDINTQNRIYEIFIDVICETQTPSEVTALLNDFFTPTERVMLPKRLCIAFLLLKGYDHRAIASYLKVSFTTINRVSTTLKISGKGYTMVLSRLQKREQFETVLKKIEDGIISMLASVGGPSRIWNSLENENRLSTTDKSRPF